RGLRGWVRDHPGPWARALGRARREARDAACDEAVAMLRRQLRSEEDKTVFRAAAALAARFGAARGRGRAAKADGPVDVMEWYDALPEGERRQLDEVVEEINGEVGADG